jgi:hypothetical protein
MATNCCMERFSQRTENREQRTENREQRTGNRDQGTEIREPKLGELGIWVEVLFCTEVVAEAAGRCEAEVVR